ncbi:MAG: tRNA (adenosine(37)-N6)-dimethylallyltransferase MiaA [Aeromicrobium sp.]|uniref:tRNA (adenosine(37)-N6)-dimethylallyltransferase MiaA n=1 Tax=Aeromicrobium sp. TaxID=1871063 RepID=UPI002630A770|nr:tRNA (adenosine(37)-N6)-dimethylallyltransferase MiaA [Aeromicrobium sp.]MDF1703223.1 tRNA (adenosine(37)-N6)-dimethylallyltransferase MiaA [Aeromicrobium sp.]
MGRVDHLVAVVGPTGVGKSDLAIELACRLGGEVISTDAYQLYRDMDIGTAKTPVAERRGVPHHLVDVLDLAQAASVAQFQTAARRAVADCQARGVVPIVVGGSSLYVRAVLDDLDFPGTDPDVRARWTRRLDQVGSAVLHRELAGRDPAAAAQILPSNGRRIVRALEVLELTGQPFRAHMPAYESVIGPVSLVGLTADRDVLDARLAARVDAMWEAGLVEEVQALAARGLADSPTASRALGYAEVLDLIAGRIDEQEARDRTVRGTQRFARRQERLFGKDPRVTWLPHDAPDLVDRAVAAASSPPHPA